jgi:flavodoxin
MKSIVIYYSYSGNTRKVAEVLEKYLKDKAGVQIIELKSLDESNNFFKQASRAFRHIKAKIEPVNFDLSCYDTVCLGTPVWAFGPAPTVNTYLDNCLGITGKDIVLFSTYGSGTGNQRCLNYMQRILAKKGARNFKRFSIQQYKVDKQEFVLSQIKEALI